MSKLEAEISRRGFLKSATAAGIALGAAYVTPRILTVGPRPAYAAGTDPSGPPTPTNCNGISVFRSLSAFNTATATDTLITFDSLPSDINTLTTVELNGNVRFRTLAGELRSDGSGPTPPMLSQGEVPENSTPTSVEFSAGTGAVGLIVIATAGFSSGNPFVGPRVTVLDFAGNSCAVELPVATSVPEFVGFSSVSGIQKITLVDNNPGAGANFGIDDVRYEAGTGF